MKGVVFGNNAVHLTHLQFTDDTILFLKPCLDSLLNSRRILRCFEMVSGLKINFHKSCVVKVGKKGDNNSGWAEAFRCKRADLPITYLGFPLGARPGLTSVRNPILSRIESRLVPWKKKFLNKWGRLVLIKAVLTSVPTYFMSVFKLPVGVANRMEKIQRSFFWGDEI